MDKNGSTQALEWKTVSYPIRLLFGISTSDDMGLLVVYECEDGTSAYLKVLFNYTTGPYIKKVKFIDEKEGESRVVWRVKIVKPEQRLLPFLGAKEEWTVEHILIRRDAQIIPGGNMLPEKTVWQR